jgi:hypothetical protein
MIKNIPNPEDFHILAKECFFKSFDMTFSLYREYYYSCISEGKEDLYAEADFLNHNDITLRTSLIVLHQGVEYYLKYFTAKKSPLFLLDKSPAELPLLPDSKDKDFNELNTISGDNLISIFCGLSEKNKDELTKICSEYNELKKQRNLVVHSISDKKTDLKIILNNFLFFHRQFNEKNWFHFLKEMYAQNPIFGIDDSELEEADFYMILDFVEKNIGKNSLQKEIESVDIKKRRYLCPLCSSQISRYEYYPDISKWAFLNPNTPNSKKLLCLNCEKETEIERKKCGKDNCKGNVIYDNTCMTCYNGELSKIREN